MIRKEIRGLKNSYWSMRILFAILMVFILVSCNVSTNNTELENLTLSVAPTLSSKPEKQDLATSGQTVSVAIDTVPFDDAIVKLGRARGTRTLFDTGYLHNFVYKLSDGRFGLVGCNKQLKAEIMYYDSCRYIDTSTGKVVSEYIEKDGVRVEVKDK